MKYQPQHEITISPYPLGDPPLPFVFGAICSCRWDRQPTSLELLQRAIDKHYLDVGFLVPAEREDR